LTLCLAETLFITYGCWLVAKESVHINALSYPNNPHTPVLGADVTDVLNHLPMLSSNTRRGCAMLSSSGKGMRHFFGLCRDLGKILEKLNRISEGKPDFEYEPIRPDYSEKTTLELVYTFCLNWVSPFSSLHVYQ
jgi:hypothetical protein